MTAFLEWFFANLNYGTVTLLMLLESTIVPIPSEFVLPPAGFLSAEGEMNIFLVILLGILGSDLGATINYVVSYYVGRPVVYAFANSHLGHLCLLNEEKVKHAEQFFIKNGAVSTLVGRLIPGIRHLISIPAGLAKMNYWHFLLYTSIGAGVWSTILAVLGYWLHSYMSMKELIDNIGYYSYEIKIVLLVLGILLVLYLVWHKMKKKRAMSKK